MTSEKEEEEIKPYIMEKVQSAIILCLGDKINEFIKLLDDLENHRVKLEEENKALILLNSLQRIMRTSRMQCCTTGKNLLLLKKCNLPYKLRNYKKR